MSITDHALANMRPPPDAPASAWATKIAACWRTSFEAILEVGHLLTEAKAALPHGDFGGMIAEALPFTARTAQMLMAIAADPRITNPKHVSLLPASWGTLYEITKLTDEDFEAKVADGALRPDVERNEVAKWTGIRNAASRRNLAQELSDCSALQPTGRRFGCVYADPAWKRKAGIGNRAYENHYVTMTWVEILAMPVRERLLPDAWGFVWFPRAHLLALVECEIETPLGRCTMNIPLAWAIQIKWGFDSYSTMAVWTKTDDECPEDHGTGLVFYDQDEVLLVFKRGRGLPKPDTDKKHGSNHRERAGGHSAKPTYYRDMINDMTGGVPTLELFAREDDEHPLPANFFTWGNQSTNSAEQPSPALADDEPHDPETGEIHASEAATATP